MELTTLKQKLVRKKNRKLRRLRELYPDVRIKLFYARDFRMLLLKFGGSRSSTSSRGRPARRRPPHGGPDRDRGRRGGRPGPGRCRPPSWVSVAGRRRCVTPGAAADSELAGEAHPIGPASTSRGATAAAGNGGAVPGPDSRAPLVICPAAPGCPVIASAGVHRTAGGAIIATYRDPAPRGGSAEPPMTRTADLQADIGEVLLSEEAIAARVAELGRQIAADYAGRKLTLVSVLKGSLPFMADLMRQIPLPLRIDLMEVSSYGGTATESSGLVRIIKDLSASIADEDVLLVEDIIDTGSRSTTSSATCAARARLSLRICTLLDKPARRLVDIPVDYQGFEIPDQFVVGYGLDFGERYRNLRFVGVLRPEVYSPAD